MAASNKNQKAEARKKEREEKKRARQEQRRERDDERWDRRRQRRGFRIPFKKTLVLGAAAAIAITWMDPRYMPSVREACSHMHLVTDKLMNYNAPTTVAERAKMQESWIYRLQRLWSKAQKEFCW